MTEPLDIRLKNELPEIHRLAELVEEFGDAYRIPARAVFNLNLVLDEVLTNVIEYAFTDGGEHEILVRLSLGGGTLGAEVVDDGVAYDPTARPEPDTSLSIEDRPIGGLGIHFARRMMDRVEYVRDGNLNRLALWKRIDLGNA